MSCNTEQKKADWSIYLRHVYTAFKEGTICCIVSTNVTIFTPVAREGSIHTGQAAVKNKKEDKH